MYLKSCRVGSDNSYCQGSRDQAQILKLAIAEQTSAENQRERKYLLQDKQMSGQECVAFNSNNNVPAGRTGTELDRQQECLD